MAASASPNAAEGIQASAFKRIYPEQYYAEFVSRQLRPDGRTLEETRPATIGVGTIQSADSSALVKVGNTTVLAGIKLELMMPEGDEGALAVHVEMAAFGCASMRPGRPNEAAHCLSAQLETALAGALDTGQLAVDGVAGAAWQILLDVYILDADGALLDACLLAAAAALLCVRLPPAQVSGRSDEVVVQAPADGQPSEGVQGGRSLQLAAVPLAATFAVCSGQLVADPTSEEEELASSLMSVTMDAHGRLLGLHKAGGVAAASAQHLQRCFQAAQSRRRELGAILDEACGPQGLSEA